MESVWWAFKTLYEKGKIYEGERVLMYCTRDATPLSKAEVTMDSGSYQDVTDPSVFVKFRLKDEDSSLLAWTTTPWTLLANTAVAVNKDFDYVEVEVNGERLILAKSLVQKVLTNEKHQILDYKVLREIKGKELVGKTYEPLIGASRGNNAHKVWHADYVSSEDGSGIVHLAPAYGEEDFELAQAKDVPVVHVIDANGFYTEGDWRGQNVWEVNKAIAKTLHERSIVWKIEYIRHSYPHCYRCGTRLMYRAHPSWFMDIEGQREKMLIENTEHITWFPEHIKHGRFEKTVETAPDWNLSRDRFWATAMPVWEGVDESGKKFQKVIGSYQELKELSGRELKDYHRPWVDDIEFDFEGVHYKRIDKVMDCWFESGSMPFAQFHYPFENVEKFEQNYAGDFITEYVGQVRAWFYYVHTVNVGLFGRNAFKNVIVTGNLAGDDGRKMSKSYGNYTDPNELMDKYSADALRFLFLSSPLLNAEDFSLHDKDVADVNRKLAMVGNMYDFFTMYAEVDGWQWNGKLEDPLEECQNPLDQWIISRLHQLVQEVEKNMDAYDIPNAVKPILPFLEDASNWYVRRSRRRFWKSGDDKDKNDAYKTLHYILVRLMYVMAPFTPFLADEYFQKLTSDQSIHLQNWLPGGHLNELELQAMENVRAVVTKGLSLRAQDGIKVRQPLQSATINVEMNDFYQNILREELNVKKVIYKKDDSATPTVLVNKKITPELKREGLAREIIRHVQSARKKAGLNVDDRINLELKTQNDQLQKTIKEHKETIKTETLTSRLSEVKNGFESVVKIEDLALTISLTKT